LSNKKAQALLGYFVGSKSGYRITGNRGTMRSATMLMILINGFTAGPAVSLYGSPTVSPVTAAL
jgi:hypothetical protein